MSAAPRLICHGSGNRQFHLSSRARLAPEIQVRADSLCSLAHTGYAKVSGLSPSLQYFRVDPLAIVAHPQTKLILIVPDLRFDVPGRGMCKGISDHFARDTIDLVLEHWRQV